MTRISFENMRDEFKRVLLRLNFDAKKSTLLANTFAENSLDGVYTHGLNRFPSFVGQVKKRLVKTAAEPGVVEKLGALEVWSGNLAPGIYTAKKCMDRAMELAATYGIGCVSVKHTNHWLRGGTYGWQAANAGFASICFTNASAGMPPWGGIDARLGNNPLVIAVPHPNGHIVLDMALSQFSYGKLQQYEFAGKELPFDGGYNSAGELTRNPSEISSSKRALPIGYWKGSGLALLLDVLLVALSGGKSVADITHSGEESDACQCFIAFKKADWHDRLTGEILSYTKSSRPEKKDGKISYPGENTLRARQQNLELGIPVEEKVWQQVLAM